MTINQIITLLGIAVAALVAVGVGYSNRKQARQIELYRQDPSVGLEPPPSALTKFLKVWWVFIFCGFLLPCSSIALSLLGGDPLSKVLMVSISLNVAIIVFNVAMIVLLKVTDQTRNTIVRVLELTARHVQITERLSDEVIGLRDKSVPKSET